MRNITIEKTLGIREREREGGKKNKYEKREGYKLKGRKREKEYEEEKRKLMSEKEWA